MKKLIILAMLIISIFGFTACSCNKSQISYSESRVQIFENEEYVIDENKVSILGKTSEYSIFSMNDDIARVEGNVVVPVSVGSTQIRLKLATKKDVHTDIEFVVKEGKIAKTVSVQKSRIDLDMSDEILTALNKCVTNIDCDEVPSVNYDNTIISYDYISGVVTAKEAGYTKVTISFLKCETSFDVYVTKNIYATFMSVNDICLYANSSGKIDFQIFPANANTYNFYLSNEDKDCTDFIIYSDGTYITYTPTTITLNYFFFSAKNQRSEIGSFEVKVVEKIQDFDIQIRDNKGALVTNFLVNNTYKIILDIGQNYDTPIISINGDFTNKSSISYVEYSGYEMTFLYDQIGSKNIVINYNLRLGNVDNIIIKTLNFQITDKTVIEIGGKWSSLTLEKNAEGKYQIFLDGKEGLRANYLAIMLKVNGDFDNTLIYDVYMIASDNSRTKVDNVFYPTETGEFTFEVEFEGESIGKIIVVVE